jgi:hypothetical protein
MNQLVLIFISFFVFLTDASIMAQADSVKVRYGEVIILADSAIVKLERTTRKFKEVKGYRVQIFLGSLEETKGERNKYLSQGLPYSAYIKQIVPEHALQIGVLRKLKNIIQTRLLLCLLSRVQKGLLLRNHLLTKISTGRFRCGIHLPLPKSTF